MPRWTIGHATITAIVEIENRLAPNFMYHQLDEAAVRQRAANAPWLRPHFVNDDGSLRHTIQCLVIDTGDHRIAVDTGIGNDKDRQGELWHRRQGPFLQQLVSAGLPAETITEVVCTHLHVDHVGWNTRLVQGRWRPTFPKARYLFVEAELDHWRSNQDRYRGDPVFSDSIAPILDAGQADLVASDHHIGDAVRFQPTPGHTPGHVSVVIRSNGERAVLTGDLAHSPLQLADPALAAAFDTDQDMARRSRREALAGWADGRTLLIGVHFGTPSAGILHADGDGYRLMVDAAR